MDYTSIRRGDALVNETYVYKVLAVSPEVGLVCFGLMALLRL